MKTIRIIVICAVTVSCLLVVYSYRWEIGDFVIRDFPAVKIQTYTSPDKRYLATVYFKRDSAESNFHSFLNIGTGSESFSRDNRIIRLIGSTAIECSWKDEHLLVVKYYGDEDTDDGPPLTQWREVKIEYIKLVDPHDTAGWAGTLVDIATDKTVMRVGMDYYKARAMLSGLRAEEISLKVKLPHTYVPPSERYNSYRLPSGTVIEIYGRPHYAGFALFQIIVSSDKLETWTGETPPEIQNKELDLHLIGVKEFDLKKMLKNKPKKSVLESRAGKTESGLAAWGRKQAGCGRSPSQAVVSPAQA
jgi:hypothetical protein